MTPAYYEIGMLRRGDVIDYDSETLGRETYLVVASESAGKDTWYISWIEVSAKGLVTRRDATTSVNTAFCSTRTCTLVLRGPRVQT